MDAGLPSHVGQRSAVANSVSVWIGEAENAHDPEVGHDPVAGPALLCGAGCGRDPVVAEAFAGDVPGHAETAIVSRMRGFRGRRCVASVPTGCSSAG
jgi:hypothetical protein